MSCRLLTAGANIIHFNNMMYPFIKIIFIFLVSYNRREHQTSAGGAIWRMAVPTPYPYELSKRLDSVRESRRYPLSSQCLTQECEKLFLIILKAASGLGGIFTIIFIGHYGDERFWRRGEIDSGKSDWRGFGRADGLPLRRFEGSH